MDGTRPEDEHQFPMEVQATDQTRVLRKHAVWTLFLRPTISLYKYTSIGWSYLQLLAVDITYI